VIFIERGYGVTQLAKALARFLPPNPFYLANADKTSAAEECRPPASTRGESAQRPEFLEKGSALTSSGLSTVGNADDNAGGRDGTAWM
jgi:hypothetical protein